MINQGRCVNVNINALFMSRKKRNRMIVREYNNGDMKLYSFFIEPCESPFITLFSLETDAL